MTRRPWLSLALVAACASPSPAPRPVDPGASSAFASALALQREGAAGWQNEARSFVQKSLEIEADWVAPRRFLDDLARADLMGHAALAEHLERLAAQPGTRGSAYLAGRLEGLDGGRRFREATPGNANTAWILHGRAWLHAQRGELRSALALERRALARARDSWEATYFALSGSRYSLRLGREAEALAWIESVLGREGLSSGDRLTLELVLAPLEMRQEDEERRLRGYWRALAILNQEPLAGDELNALVAPMFGLIAARLGSCNLEELHSALTSFDTPDRRRLRARLLFDRGARSMALGLLGPMGPGESEALRAERIARGGIDAWLEQWLEALPAQVLEQDGLPRSPALRRVIEAARAGSDAEARFALGEALLAAGWFAEAQALANPLAEHDLPRALRLERRATEGRATLRGIERLFDVLDQGKPFLGPRLEPSEEEPPELTMESRRISSLSQLLASLEPLFLRHQPDSGVRLQDTPRLPIGPFATILHPGPRFNQRDQQRGLGQAGQRVPGLASALARLGRFGVFGALHLSGALDGTVMRELAHEEIEGEHLGVRFSGNRIWCEGADLGSQPARRGAHIAGAAVHEGYWIDVAEVRRDLARWHELEARFFSGDGAKAERALAAQGPRLPSVLATAGSEGPQLLRVRNAEHRQSVYAALGEADRIRLAVLRDRRAASLQEPGAPALSMTLEELLEVTARHEEGHLTDQTRFLPIGEHFYAALGFLFQVGFSGSRLSEELEYRAQLVSLCVSADPRIPLADCVMALESAGELTTHASAYQRLVVDLLETLEASPELRAELDAERYWLHQLHHLDAEEVRALGLALAERRGLVRKP